MTIKTTILPSSRAIRSHILKEQGEDGFLPNFLTIGEFLQRVLRVDGYHRVDDDTRTLLLLEAADFKNFESLNIERNFFTFIQNASFLFRFFEELSGELVEIGTLEFADTYGDYEEHIAILNELFIDTGRFVKKKVLDPIFLPQQYTLNENYLKSLGEVELNALGYLTNFEMQVLLECARITPFSLRYSANRFNTKLTRKLEKLGIDIAADSTQTIDLTTLAVGEIQENSEQIKAEVESFSQSLLQVGFIKQKVYSFVEKGIVPEKIVVVLPDESFARHLRRFDDEGNFNFAMGIPLSESYLIEGLEAVMNYLENQSVENTARLNRVGAELLDGLFPHYRSPVSGLEFSVLMAPFIEKEHDKAVIDIVNEELYYFEKIIPALGDAPLKSALHLFVNRLKARSIDDVRGGKITVMGVLETRLVEYDGVIVVDFNENIVPRKSEKDLFLNSATRSNASLPTTGEREDLQKLYYHSLFTRAKEVAISYVSSSDAVPSRFLTQLGQKLDSRQRDEAYAPIIMKMQTRHKVPLRKIEGEYDFTKRTLSSTALTTFLTCRRKFYHRYIEGIKNHEIAKDMPKEHEIGSALHDALRIVYEEKDHFTEIKPLKKALSKALDQCSGKSVLDRYLHKLWMKRLEPFLEHEIERFKEVRVHSCEKQLETEVRGIKLFGVIDRIDATGDGLEVLDYKSGAYKTYTLKTLENAKDFQLEFYYLLASQLGEVHGCGFYDLNSGKIIRESVLHEKLEKLYRILDELRENSHFDFEMTDRMSDCSYCEFAQLCQRGAVMAAFIPFHAYEASAGAGKTFSLVVRYLSLLFMDEDADKILALTFTNKAANEMQERIIETLMHFQERDERFEVAKVTGIDTEKLLQQRQAVLERFLRSDAKVMTIDKFFAKILRKFSLHAGLMPTFSTFASQHEIKVMARFLTLANIRGQENDLIALSLMASKRLRDIFSLLNELYGKRKEMGVQRFQSGDYLAIENEIMSNFSSLQSMVFASNMSEGAKNTMQCESVDEMLTKAWIEKESLDYWQYKKGYLPDMDERLHTIQILIPSYMRAKEAHFFNALFGLLDIYEEAKMMVAKEDGELSFDDITNLVYSLLKERVDSEFLYFRLDARISHILLDEFQDTSVVQFDILKPLIDEMSSGKGVSEHNSLFIVGDVKQSIYRFRGGTKELFYYVAEKYRVTVDNLLTNYRSDANVVNFVNEVFREKIANYKPQLVRSGAEQGYVEVIHNDEILEGMRDKVLSLIEKGADPDSIAILTQTNGDGSEVESMLREAGVEVVTETTSLLINQKNIRALIEYLKYSYFNESIYARNFFALLELEVGTLKPCNVGARDLAAELLKVIEAYGLFDGDLNLLRFLQLLGNYSDIEAFLFEYERLDATAAQADLHGVRVLTVHKSKGLEFENVFVIDRLGRPKADSSTIIYQYDGIALQQIYLRMNKRASFDSSYAQALADEERLSYEDGMHALYVAFTRAKRRLYIIQKSKDSKFEDLGLSEQTWGEEQITVQHLVKKEQAEVLAYEPRSYGVQSEIIKEEREEEKDQHAIEFGLALHYTLEMMALFEESAIEEALSVAMNRYGAYLSEDDFTSIKKRIGHLVNDAHFKTLSDGVTAKERAISYASELRYIDLLVQKPGEWIIMDYKSAKGHSEQYYQQVGFYKKAVASITNEKVSAFLVYLLEEGCEIVEV